MSLNAEIVPGIDVNFWIFKVRSSGPLAFWHRLGNILHRIQGAFRHMQGTFRHIQGKGSHKPNPFHSARVTHACPYGSCLVMVGRETM
jgi:hypothetical protein